MIRLQGVILIAVGLTCAAATSGDRGGPNCTSCEYQNGIGFLPLRRFCDAYIMCFKSPYQKDYYRHKIMCCPIGTSWNQEHLTCKKDPKCTSTRYICPNETTTSDLPCPFKPVEGDPSKYSYKATHEVMSCPYRSEFDEKICTCRFGGPYKKPCCKLLHFDFNNTYDSRSCYNFAAGEAYGRPSLDGNILCLNGENQFFAIPYLRNYFAWNPIARSFTICFFLKAKTGQTAGVLSTNCKDPMGNSLLEIWLEAGKLTVQFGMETIRKDEAPNYDVWSHICVTYKKGHYVLFYDGAHIIHRTIKSNQPFNSQQDPTLGFVKGKGLLNGYFDDFCFWTKTLNKKNIKKIMAEGPSNP